MTKIEATDGEATRAEAMASAADLENDSSAILEGSSAYWEVIRDSRGHARARAFARLADAEAYLQ